MIHRPALFVGVSLAAAGAVMLAGLGNVAARDAIPQALQLWPVALIALGVGLLVRRTPAAIAGLVVAATLSGAFVGGAVVAAPNVGAICTADTRTPDVTRRGAFSGPATVDLEIGCGELVVSTADGSAWALDTLATAGVGVDVVAGADRLVVRSGHIGWGGRRHGSSDAWRLTLPTDMAIDLAVEVNAGRGRLDLAGAQVRDLGLDVHFGSATVVLPATTDLRGEMEVAGGSLTICVPDGLGVRIRGDVEFGDATFNGLVRADGAWESPDFATARYTADLDVTARAASVVVNPAGGCS